MLLLSAVLLVLSSADAFIIFPTVCVQNVTSFPIICCPLFNDSQCGAFYNRGSCLAIPRSRAVDNPDITLDDRHGFPSYYFTHRCVCKNGFAGFNCGDCTFGRDGNNCDKIIVNPRREIRELSLKERELFFAQLHYCKTKLDPDSRILRAGDRYRRKAFEFLPASYYDNWCYVHYYATKPFINNTRENFILNYAHGSSGFLTWHRLYLLHLEKAMQRCLKDPTFALPYYDWGRDTDCAACKDGFLGGNDDLGRLSKWSVFSTWDVICGHFDYDATYCLMSDFGCERPPIIRNPGTAPGFGKPGPLDIQHCLNLRVYDSPPYTSRSTQSARNCMEGWVDRNELQGVSMHNGFHVYCGGTMAQVPISCNDPLFVLHHVFIDKIFERNIQAYGWNENSYPADNNIYGHGAYDCITPFHTCWRHRDMLVTSTRFGYSYTPYGNF